MKKSVILTIVVIYVLSVVAVGLLGMKLAVYDEIKYVSSISVVSSPDGDYTVKSKQEYDGTWYDLIRVTYTSGLKFQIHYEVEPIDATDKTVEFNFDVGEYADYIEISPSGVVTVKQPPSGRFIYAEGYVAAQDGSRVVSRKIKVQVDAVA